MLICARHHFLHVAIPSVRNVPALQGMPFAGRNAMECVPNLVHFGYIVDLIIHALFIFPWSISAWKVQRNVPDRIRSTGDILTVMDDEDNV